MFEEDNLKMPNVICSVCSEIFYVKPGHLKIGWGKYCSRKCQFQGQKTGRLVPCAECGKNTYRSLGQIKRSRGRSFCDKACLMAWKNKNILSGENHSRWKDGEGSYRKAMMRRTKAPICEGCGLHDIRILVVHHVDRNRKNNVPENLRWLCRNCHYLEHYGKAF
jgi:hypothetical protein